jgi:hypothetical protein
MKGTTTISMPENEPRASKTRYRGLAQTYMELPRIRIPAIERPGRKRMQRNRVLRATGWR